MAIYHLSAKVFSRGKGHSAVAAAAYRARTDMKAERTGEVHDYTRKGEDVLFTGLYAPADAPLWAQERESLWNHVEAFEKRKDARLAREIVIALPGELTTEQNRYALQDWVRENFTRKGMIADVAIHRPGRQGDQRNIHAHIMVPLRRLDGDELAAKKERAPEISELKAELEGLRLSWEKIGNRHLERHGFAPTLDRRTLAEQGKEQAATLHLGKAATALERKGIATDLGDYNREAQDLQRRRQGEERERGDRDDRPRAGENERATVATADAGMVAQQREAMRLLRFQELQRQMRAEGLSNGNDGHEPDRPRRRER